MQWNPWLLNMVNLLVELLYYYCKEKEERKLGLLYSWLSLNALLYKTYTYTVRTTNSWSKLFKQSLASVKQNRVLRHFQFAERFNVNTIYCEQNGLEKH